ncbi:MAG: TIR domain-containing protein, partial [Bacilli bacterium]|nr:TIR domain-containing protein [Bacilli bacterium]
YRYECIKVNTVEEYLEAVNSGYTSIDYPKDIKGDLLIALREHKEESEDLFAYYLLVLGNSDYGDEDLKSLEALAEKGNPVALRKCGSYFGSLENDESKKKAVSFWLEAASQGDAFSMNNLGVCYEFGDRVPKDLEEAVRWYRKSAEQGNAYAQKNLAICYENGQGVPKDIEEAIRWYRKAAEQGNAYAQICLGCCYQLGQGVPEDLEEAIRWHRKAAEQGEADAQFLLGYCYFNGHGVPQDLEEAAMWYRKAAERGYASAQLSLGNCYEFGQGVPMDLEEAVRWYRKAAEQGDASAQFSLGNCYHDSQGVPKDFEEAVRWYRKAAEQEEKAAKHKIAVCYLCGEGVEQNEKKGVAMLFELAKQKFPYSLSILGYIYEFGGFGLPVDLNLALSFYKEAYDNGMVEREEDILRVESLIQARSHENLKVPEDIDIFLSWNHHDLDFKEKLCAKLEENGVRIWESDSKAEGNLDADVNYAIAHAKGFIILLSKGAITSSYMPKEAEWIQNRLERERLPDTLIKIYYLDDPEELGKEIDALEEEHPYHALRSLTDDFSSNVDHVISFAKKTIREYTVLDYGNKLRECFDVFPISLSGIMVQQENRNIVASLHYEQGYIARNLFDKEGKEYSPEDLLSLDKIALIHGEGGAGKSLYLKNLIRSYSDDSLLFFYLPSAEIRETLEKGKGKDLLSLITKIAFPLAKYKNIDEAMVNDIFNNDSRTFYLIIDALDESGDHKNEILKFVKDYLNSPSSKPIHIILSSRSALDASEAEAILGKEVEPLSLSPLNDVDALKLFDAVYDRNHLSKEEEKSSLGDISRDAFKTYLTLLDEDIKKNPLLISNIIYIYFATRSLETQRSFILEKSNDILINYLENERGTFIFAKPILQDLGIELGPLLEFLAFRLLTNPRSTLESEVKTYLEKLGKTVSSDDVESLSNYLRRRRIILGNRFSHDIYLSYFAARYVYDNVIERKIDFDFGDDYLAYKEGGEGKLEKYSSRFFSLDTGLYPSLTMDFICKLDLELHYVDKGDTDSPSFALFDDALAKVASSYGEIASSLLLEMASKDTLLYYGKRILKDIKK